MERESFIFDGIKSSDMGVSIVKMDASVLNPTPYFGGQELSETINGNGESFLYGTEMTPIEFTIQISLLDEKWTSKRRNEIASWLIHRSFKPFQTTDDLGKYYFVICTQFPQLELSGEKGYGELTFRANAPYAWSSEVVTTSRMSEGETSSIIEIDNIGNIFDYYEPKIEVKLLSGTGFKLVNLSDGGREFEFTELSENETISVDNKNKFIKTDRKMEHRYENFNKNWLRLVRGKNRIQVHGDVNIQIKARYPIVQ